MTGEMGGNAERKGGSSRIVPPLSRRHSGAPLNRRRTPRKRTN